MPDAAQILKGTAAAALVTAILLALLRSRWVRQPRGEISLAEVLSFAAGLYAGCLVLGIRPRSFLREDQDRLLAILLPLALAVELLASRRNCPPAVALALRSLVGIAIVPILLFGTSYVSDVAGPGTREWSAATLTLVLGGCAAGFLAECSALAALARRGNAIAEIAGLAIVCGGTGVTIMFSGYASGGQIGLALSAALAAVAAIRWATSGNSPPEGILTLALAGLFSLIVIGLGFGELSPVHAGVLLAAALAGSLWELPHPRRIAPAIRTLGKLATISLAVAAVVLDAQRKFAAAYPLGGSATVLNTTRQARDQARSARPRSRAARTAAPSATAAIPP
jgi:hypothetical protein